MREFGFTAGDLAEAINDAAQRQTGARTDATETTVFRWLSGHVQWPWTRYHGPLGEVFGRPPAELGFIPRGKHSATSLSAGTPRLMGHIARAPVEDEVHRRNFLGLAAGTTLVGALPEMPSSGTIGMTDVARLDVAMGGLWKRDDEHGGVGLADITEHYVLHIRESMGRCTYGSGVRTALYGALGRFSAGAGWFALDAGDHPKAERNFDVGLRFAVLGGNRDLQAQIWNFMSMRARLVGDPGEAATLAAAGLAALGHRGSPRLRSLLWARAAVGHAYHGNSTEAYRALHVAHRTLARAGDEAPPPWLSFYTPAELDGLTALVQHRLGQFAAAEDNAASALASLPGQCGRNRYFYTSQLALTQLARRDVERACATAHRALAMIPAVQSPRSAEKLIVFRRKLEVYSSVPAAREFTDRFRAAFGPGTTSEKSPEKTGEKTT